MINFPDPRGRAHSLFIYFIIFFCSGFSGLIYESIWSHYLKLFLGHAAYAQTLVLIIFMGGMGMGAYFAGRFSEKRKNLLLLYGITEGFVGIFGVMFHKLYIFTTDVTLDVFLPFLSDPFLITVVRWSLCAALILPQSILLGATFPLMTAGIIRKFPFSHGKTIAGLYFVNSLGAAIGVLCNGFILIRQVGLPGASLTAGLINLCLALLVWLMSRRDCYAYHAEPLQRKTFSRAPYVLLLIAAGTGAASFIYEIAWIRMLSIVLGSATHSFELMLSAFILGLSIGGLLVQRLISTLSDSARFLGYVQILMGILALLTLVVYNYTFNIMVLLLKALYVNIHGYFLFNLFSYGICLLIMLPATICAGMTLPLLTKLLLEREGSDSAIGKVYAANTIGSIFGVLIAVHFVMPLFGLKVLMLVGGTVDVGLGILLLTPHRIATLRTREGFPILLGLTIILLVALFARLDPMKMSSGVYRLGKIRSPHEAKILFHRDGKTATVDLVQFATGKSIMTNGKPDASIANNASVTKAIFLPTTDEPTMVLAAALPLAIEPGVRRVANIGVGSGLTTHVLLTMPSVETVDTIEIEPRMAEAARLFGDRVSNTFHDARSHIYFDDAKSFFASRKGTYDLIISEPSNPWVSGVSSLFTEEFYRRIAQNLQPNGLFAQWVQGYEINKGLIGSIYKAMSLTFTDIHLYQVSSVDFLFVSCKQGNLSLPGAHIFDEEPLAAELRFIGVHNRNDLLARWIAGKETLDHFFSVMDEPVNSDYFPFVDFHAARARFLRHAAIDLEALRTIPLLPRPALDAMTPQAFLTESVAFSFAARYNDGIRLLARASLIRDGGRRDAREKFQNLVSGELDDFLCSCQCSISSSALLSTKYLAIVQKVLPILSPSQLVTFTEFFSSSPCYSALNPEIRNLNNILYLAALGRHEQCASLMKEFLADQKLAVTPEGLMVIKIALAVYITAEDHQASRALMSKLVDLQVNDTIQLPYLIALARAKSDG